MKKLILLALLAASAPTVDLPLPARQSNWCDGDGRGSCVVASFVSLLRWQGRPCTAEHFRRTYSGPQGPTRFDATLDEENVRYAETRSGDESFLDWSIRTRRGCAVAVDDGQHMVCLVGLTDSEAILLDNNDVRHLIRVSRGDFLDDWRGSHGWAITPVYSPAAPTPIYN